MKVFEMIEWLQKQDQEAIVQVSIGNVFFETFKEKMAEYYPSEGRRSPAVLLLGGEVSGD